MRAAGVSYEPVWGQILLYYSLARDYPLAGNSNPSCRREQNLFTMEVAMKVSVTLLSLALAGAVLSAVPAGAQEAAAGEKNAQASKKETKWQGHVIRIDKDHSMIDLRGGSPPVERPKEGCLRQLHRVDQARKGLAAGRGQGRVVCNPAGPFGSQGRTARYANRPEASSINLSKFHAPELCWRRRGSSFFRWIGGGSGA